MAHENRERIAPLSDLDDFEVADHDPDVRGWDVISADGRKIGEVEDLIVDTGAMKVRYLDVEIDKDYRTDDNRRMLIPVGQARLHDDEDHVHVNALSSSELKTFPRHSGRFDRTYEDSVHRHFGSTSDTGAGTDYYAHSHFDDDSFYGKRRGTGSTTDRSLTGRGSTSRGRTDSPSTARDASGRQDRMTLSEEELAVGKTRHSAGEVRVGKHVETEHVSKDVPVRRESATVERRPLNASDARNARPEITDDEIRVPLMEEEVVVEKRVVPKEELVVKKHTTQETERVEADLRRERADVEGADETTRNRGRDKR
jgi:uncharacterized protein (TIGR02271 family)